MRYNTASERALTSVNQLEARVIKLEIILSEVNQKLDKLLNCISNSNNLGTHPNSATSINSNRFGFGQPK